jgi:cellobiose dehydrogenase (acceptor)
MKVTSLFKAASLLSSLFASSVDAQAASFTHAKTGITFFKQTIPEAQTTGGFEWGFALPATAGGTNDEYIGYMVSFATVGCDLSVY